MSNQIQCKNCLTIPRMEQRRLAERLSQDLICEECLSTEFDVFVMPLHRQTKKLLSQLKSKR